MFDVERFTADCRAAIADDPTHKSVRDIVTRVVSDPSAVLRSLGEPARAGNNILYRSPTLTILNIVWGPRMSIMPHNHNMWAVLGIYTGGEDNIFWRRRPDGGGIEAAGARSLRVGDVDALGVDVIHSVLNPVNRLTGAIHVYGGDFVAAERSEWDPEHLVEGQFDRDKVQRMFDESNAALARA